MPQDTTHTLRLLWARGEDELPPVALSQGSERPTQMAEGGGKPCVSAPSKDERAEGALEAETAAGERRHTSPRATGQAGQLDPGAPTALAHLQPASLPKASSTPAQQLARSVAPLPQQERHTGEQNTDPSVRGQDTQSPEEATQHLHDNAGRGTHLPLSGNTSKQRTDTSSE